MNTMERMQSDIYSLEGERDSLKARNAALVEALKKALPLVAMSSSYRSVDISETIKAALAGEKGENDGD